MLKREKKAHQHIRIMCPLFAQFLSCHLIVSPGFGPGAGMVLRAAWGGEQLAGEEPFLGKQQDPWVEVR